MGVDAGRGAMRIVATGRAATAILDTEPIINQRDTDRQPSGTHVRHGPWPVAGATEVMLARPVARFRSNGPIAAILPVHARAGLLTDCKESSD